MKSTEKRVAPDERALTKMQAERLSRVAGVDAERVAGSSLAALRDDLRWEIDPELLLFRRICGRVVRYDPVTGRDQGVPGATVYVEDTDYNLFAYFPAKNPFAWLHPISSRREVIAETMTDECGNFCVWVPRFDIDWVWRWRLERECHLELLRKPSLGDLIDRLHEIVEIPPHIGPRPGPDPDPGPYLRRLLTAGIDTPRALAAAIGTDAAERLTRAAATPEAGGSRVLDEPAFRTPLPPPLPRGKDLHEHVATLRTELGHEVGKQERLRWYGPYLRCDWVLEREFVPILDVPDITFRVTQDVDGDGDEETIYAESIGDVRWNAGAIPPVTLHAASFAISSPTCDHPDLGPCAEPEIVVAGSMPLKNMTAPAYPFVDTATGFAVRPNRPHPSGRIGEVPAAAAHSTAPVAGHVDLWGCVHHLVNGTQADRYRILDDVLDPVTGLWSGPRPIRDAWSNWRVVGSPSHLEYKPMSADADGWYEVLDPADQWIPGDHFLLQWHTPADGEHVLVLELGETGPGGIAAIGQAAPVRLQVDNSPPRASIDAMRWRDANGNVTPLPLNCPTIHRGGGDVTIELDVSMAARHLRSAHVRFSGCSADSSLQPVLEHGFEGHQTGTTGPTADYWHRDASDNNVGITATYRVPANRPPGAYTVSVSAYTRAFWTFDGHVYTPSNPDVLYDPAPVWDQHTIAIAIVD